MRPEGTSFRLYAVGLGFLDITDTGPSRESGRTRTWRRWRSSISSSQTPDHEMIGTSPVQPSFIEDDKALVKSFLGAFLVNKKVQGLSSR